jgi:hypothetical protein
VPVYGMIEMQVQGRESGPSHVCAYRRTNPLVFASLPEFCINVLDSQPSGCLANTHNYTHVHTLRPPGVAELGNKLFKGGRIACVKRV